MANLKTLDVHAHFLPPDYSRALKDAGLKTLDGGMPVPPWDPERAIAMMDEVGVDGALLSVSSPHVNFVDAEQAVTLCRQVNDYATGLKQRFPDRFGAYAILPLPNIEASLAELSRATESLGLDGVALPTHADGHYLGDPLLVPLLAALHERQLTVFIHPTSPCCFEAFGLELPAPMIEFPFETTRTAASLLFSGALTRYDGIRFILPHAGGTLPFLAPRMAAIGSIPAMKDRAVPPFDTMQILAGLHYDTALSTAPQQIAALRTLAPISQILYGTDYPFANEQRVQMAEQAFGNLGLSPDEEVAIRFDNAARLFNDFAGRCRESHRHD